MSSADSPRTQGVDHCVANAHVALWDVPVERLLDALCRAALEMVGADRAAVGVRDGAELAIVAPSVWTREGRGAGSRLPLAGSVAGLVLASGEPQLILDTATDPRGGHVLTTTEKIGSSVQVPLSGPDGRSLAVLSLLWHRSDGPSVDALHRIVSLAGLVARDAPRLRAALTAARAAVQADSEQLYRAVLESLGEGVVVLGPTGQVLLHNQAACTISGLSPSAMIGQRAGHPAWQMYRIDGTPVPAADTPAATALQTGVEVRDRVVVVRRPDGQERVLSVTALPRRERGGDVYSVVVSFADITQRESALRTLEESEEVFRVTFDRAPIGMVLMDAAGTGRVLRSNATFRSMIGRRPGSDDVSDPLTPADWTDPARLGRDLAELEEFVERGGEHTSFETTYRRADGTAFEALVSAVVARDGTGRALHVVAQVMDMSERAAHGRELQRLALTDSLTGLPNRRLMEERLRNALLRRQRHGGVVGLVLLDLDHFKVVNDSLGHATGDALLVEVGARLRAQAREGTTVARLGGDEFVAVVQDARCFSDVEAVAATLVEALRMPFAVGPGRIVTTASLGVAVSEGTGSPEELLREADLALYRAKSTGRDRMIRFDAELRTRADDRLATEAMLREALAKGWLVLHLQPVVDLGTGAAVGAEALVRIAHPVRGIVPPADFVEVAEECGLVCEIDGWVLRAAVDLLAATPGTRIAVNVSARTLEAGGLPERVRTVLQARGVASDRLDVELTETSLLTGGPGVAEDLRQLRRAGCRVGLDDFGTGYSALSYLQSLELDFLKIDRSFTMHLGEGARQDAVVKAVIDLAHAHGLDVVAEGVERVEQGEALRRMGCDRGQGWLFGRPVAPHTSAGGS